VLKFIQIFIITIETSDLEPLIHNSNKKGNGEMGCIKVQWCGENHWNNTNEAAGRNEKTVSF